MPKEGSLVPTLQYMSELFQDSLLTGVPQIVQTRSITRKVLKSVVLLGCIIGFVYQTSEFLKIFWSYPTVLDLDVEYPQIIESPAITFCNLNGIKRTVFCSDYPNNCTTPKNLTAFCDTFPDVCKRHDGKDMKFPVGDGLSFEMRASEQELKKLGHTYSNTLRLCSRLKGDEFQETCNYDNMIQMALSDGNTGYRNCYTLFSSIKRPSLDKYQLEVPKRRSPLFHMVFDLEPEEYFRPDRAVGGLIAIHSPNVLVNPFFDGFVIKPGNLYNVLLKVVEEKLLPFPYETKCQDYVAMWKQRGGKGPLSQEVCVDECIFNTSLRLCNCVSPGIIYPHHERICGESDRDCLSFNISECFDVCQQPCDFTDFEYDIQERRMEYPDAKELEDFYADDMTGRLAMVLIFLKRPEIIVYSHRPQYEDIEVFSFMGGYIGMWLGISLIAVFDFLESISLVFHHWIRRRMR